MLVGVSDDAEVPADAPAGANVAARLSMSGQQRTLVAALAEKSRELSVMYEGGLYVLRDKENPERHAQAAHSMRELMEKVARLHRRQDACSRREVDGQGAFSAEGKWTIDIDGALSQFLLKLDGVFSWLETHMPRRKEEVLSVRNETGVEVEGFDL